MTEMQGDWGRTGPGGTPPQDERERQETLRRELDRLYDETARVEAALDERLGGGVPSWRISPRSIVPAGLLLGFVAAAGSLIIEVIVALLMGDHPLQMVRDALSWILGARALALQTGPALAVGTCLFLLVGAAAGLPLHQVLCRLFIAAPGIWRFLVATAVALVLWMASLLILPGTPFWLSGFTVLVYVYLILLLENWGRRGPVPL
jgi:hypothetical protein